MPSKSKAQHNLMEGVAHNAAFAKKVGIPQSVGRDFTEADKGKKFSKGGVDTQPKRQSINQPKTHHGEQALFKQGGTMASKMNPGFMAMMAKKKAGAKAEMPMKKGGTAKKMAAGGLSGAHKAADGVASKGKTKGTQISMSGNKGMKSGGMAKKYC
jgi:hypothetical protein